MEQHGHGGQAKNIQLCVDTTTHNSVNGSLCSIKKSAIPLQSCTWSL